jgi:hypothetical protein
MIAQAAYYRHEKRGGKGGDSVEDWLAAEAEIEKDLMDSCQSKPQNQEHAAYQRIRSEIRRFLAASEEKINPDALRSSFDRIAKRLQFLQEASKNFKNWMIRQRGKAR